MKKKVLLKPVVEKFTISSDASVGKYYGFVNGPLEKNDTDRGFITRESYGYGEFMPLSPIVLTNGNGWAQYKSTSLSTLINRLIEVGFTVFEFDTAKELFEWLAKI